MIFSAFFDPAGNGFDIGDLLLILGIPAAVIAAWVGLRKAWSATTHWMETNLRTMIRYELEEFTRPIQPTANGGKSLPDVNRKLDILAEAMGVQFPTNLRTDK